MRLLLLGGPRFLGRAVADAALGRGHELTFFNRGRTNPELYPELYPAVERLLGDRPHDVRALRGRSWDAVVDTCGFVPRAVCASLQELTGSGLYCFVSSISVYEDFRSPIDEESPVAQLGDLPDDEMTNESYGALKALCEDVVRTAFTERALVIRPGLIVGPHDPTGRFTYWPHRVARGGDVLAPGPPERQTQFVDVRDLGAWIVELCERGVGGTFNATNVGIRWGELLETCRSVTGSDAEVTWVPDEFLLAQGVGQWLELPLWLTGPENAFADRVDVRRAIEAGLRFRPLEETVMGALENAKPTEMSGLSPERERALLEAWHAR